MLKNTLKSDSQTVTHSHFSDVIEGYYKTKVISEFEHIKRANSETLVFYSTITETSPDSVCNFRTISI